MGYAASGPPRINGQATFTVALNSVRGEVGIARWQVRQTRADIPDAAELLDPVDAALAAYAATVGELLSRPAPPTTP